MAATMRNAGYTALGEFEGCGTSHARIEQYRLDRLIELRALVDSLRAERSQALLYGARSERILHHYP